MLEEFLKAMVVLIAVLGCLIGFCVWLTLSLNSAECSAYGRQTGRDVVFDWACYARDDNGRLVPAEQIGRKLEVTVK